MLEDAAVTPEQAEQVESVIVQGVRLFDSDPPENEYQRGFRDALFELSKVGGISLPDPETH